MDEYEIKEKVGQGSFSDVHRSICKCKEKEFAIKMIHKHKSNTQFNTRVKVEIEALTTLQHKSILSAVEYIETEDDVNIIMPLCNGNLLHFLQKRGKLSEVETRNFMSQLVSAMGYAWKKGFCHRDIKLENILMIGEQQVCIGDWGLAAKIKSSNDKFNDVVGSLPSQCPQIILEQPYKGTAADIWALGVVSYALITGKHPFHGDGDFELMQNIVRGNYTLPEDISVDLRSLLTRMLETEEKDRISISDLQNHPFLKEKKKRVPCIDANTKDTKKKKRLSIGSLIDLFRSSRRDTIIQ